MAIQIKYEPEPEKANQNTQSNSHLAELNQSWIAWDNGDPAYKWAVWLELHGNNQLARRQAFHQMRIECWAEARKWLVPIIIAIIGASGLIANRMIGDQPKHAPAEQSPVGQSATRSDRTSPQAANIVPGSNPTSSPTETHQHQPEPPLSETAKD